MLAQPPEAARSPGAPVCKWNYIPKNLLMWTFPMEPEENPCIVCSIAYPAGSGAASTHRLEKANRLGQLKISL